MVFNPYALTASDGTDVRTELSAFATEIGLERAAPERYGFVFLLGLFAGIKSDRLDPHKVVHEINVLEGFRFAPVWRTRKAAEGIVGRGHYRAS